MSLNNEKLKAFLEYKGAKINSISEIESKRLEDLKHGRDTIFKYALPATVIDAAAGAFATLLTGDILILLPVALFIILIYFLADGLDKKKVAERTDIIVYTELALEQVREQENTLLRYV